MKGKFDTGNGTYVTVTKATAKSSLLFERGNEYEKLFNKFIQSGYYTEYILLLKGTGVVPSFSWYSDGTTGLWMIGRHNEIIEALDLLMSYLHKFIDVFNYTIKDELNEIIQSQKKILLSI